MKDNVVAAKEGNKTNKENWVVTKHEYMTGGFSSMFMSRNRVRIQTFPDDFTFYYNHISAGYKMIGNAVPVNLAKHMALSIKSQIDDAENRHSQIMKRRLEVETSLL